MLWLLAVVGLASGARVRLSVIAPTLDHVQALPVILPIIELAVRNVSDRQHGLLPGVNITVAQRNSNCSSTYGPLAAMELYNHTDAFLGPVCDYVIAPVSRYAGVWGKPVITAGAQADHFFHKQEYPTLTRVMGSYRAVSIAMRHILNYFNWKIAGLLYFDYGANSSKGHSKCYLMLGPVFNSLGASSTHKSFNETTTADQFKELLIYISKSARSLFYQI